MGPNLPNTILRVFCLVSKLRPPMKIFPGWSASAIFLKVDKRIKCHYNVLKIKILWSWRYYSFQRMQIWFLEHGIQTLILAFMNKHMFQGTHVNKKTHIKRTKQIKQGKYITLHLNGIFSLLMTVSHWTQIGPWLVMYTQH